MFNKNKLSIIIGEQFKMNPPRYIERVIDDVEALEKLEQKFFFEYDKKEALAEKVKSRIALDKKQLKKLAKVPKTKMEQKQVLNRIIDLQKKQKTIQQDQKSLAGKIVSVHKYVELLGTGDYKVTKTEKLYTRKEDEALIVERQQFRKFKQSPELTDSSKKNVIGHLIQLSTSDYTQFKKEKHIQKRAVIGLVVESDKAYDPNLKQKISSLRNQWFFDAIEVLKDLKSQYKGSKRTYFTKELKKLAQMKKEKITPPECKKYIRLNYSKVSNTQGITYISTGYAAHEGQGYNSLLASSVAKALEKLINSYRLKEEEIQIASVGIIERVTVEPS